MRFYEVVFCTNAENQAKKHLLQHFQDGFSQEDLCFALWRPSTGVNRYTAIIYKIVFPEKGDQKLHGNVEFTPQFLSRAVKLAIQEKAGLAFMHSHPSDGWQDMSKADVMAERDALFYPSLATGLPLVGLTIGTDGYWSARFWKKHKNSYPQRHWCQKVRVIGQKSYKICYNDNLMPLPQKRNVLRRTFDTWGLKNQHDIARLKIGIVGLGSVGCVVAEALSRMGVNHIVLIDQDKLEEHNLDRMLYGTTNNIGEYKVHIASHFIKKHSTANKVNVTAIPMSIHYQHAYKEALDCDFLFSCVDKPVARDVLNFISMSHLIPVVDGGIKVNLTKDTSFYNSYWRTHIVIPEYQCLRCNKQYTTSDVVLELEGALDNPSYIDNLPEEQKNNNHNVFPFSLNVAGLEVNLMLRYLMSEDWWPVIQQQNYQFLTGMVKIENKRCYDHCIFKKERIAMGDQCKPHYLVDTIKPHIHTQKYRFIRRIKGIFTKLFGKRLKTF